MLIINGTEICYMVGTYQSEKTEDSEKIPFKSDNRP